MKTAILVVDRDVNQRLETAMPCPGRRITGLDRYYALARKIDQCEKRAHIDCTIQTTMTRRQFSEKSLFPEEPQL